jgi:NADH:ubiquinone oxidoreductase subunit 3 (subunit A)
MSDSWIAAVLFMAVSAAIAGLMVGLNWVLGAKSKAASAVRTTTYECGEEPDGGAWIRFHPRYYVVALVFVVFDVEAAFMLPWALGLRGGGWLTILEMGAFLTILMLGWLYALRKGALRWQ